MNGRFYVIDERRTFPEGVKPENLTGDVTFWRAAGGYTTHVREAGIFGSGMAAPHVVLVPCQYLGNAESLKVSDLLRIMKQGRAA